MKLRIKPSSRKQGRVQQWKSYVLILFFFFQGLPYIYPSRLHAVDVTITTPYSTKAHVYKGELHAHSTRSDGSSTPQVVITNYKNDGFDFLSLTDHMSNYNDPNDPTRNFLVTQNPGVTGILFIPGAEQLSANNGKRPHIGWINAVTPENNTAIDAQVLINKIVTENGIAILNHPHWPSGQIGDTWPLTSIKSVHGYTAIEIFNSMIAKTIQNAEDIWDSTLTTGIQTWGIAADDCHVQTSPSCRTAYIRVAANTLTTNEILNNIKNGNFYSGYTPHGDAEIQLTVTTSGNSITATTNIATTIEFIGSGGAIKKKETNKTTASYTPIGTEKYIRVRATKGDSKAWSNPLYITQVTASPTPTKTPTPTRSTTPTNTPVPANILGDLDNNRKVEMADYNILLTNFGKTGTSGWIGADIIRNGKVDIFDYNTLVKNFGKTQ